MRIDLNADLGESFGAWSMGDDDALLGIVTSANVACGFHAGDAETMRRVCQAAARRGVRIGAHVSYRDLAGFGRVAMDVPPKRLTAELTYQIGALVGIARTCGTDIAYVKPHGALYHRLNDDEHQARAAVESVAAAGLALLHVPGSAASRLAREAGVPVMVEAFADRAYRADGTLVPRGTVEAVITDPEQIARRAVRMVIDGNVTAATGERVSLAPDSLCVHGDTPGAVAIARTVRSGLEVAGVEVRC